MSIKKLIKHGLQKPLSNAVNYLLRVFNIFVIYRIGNAIGDQVCMSAVVRLIDKQYPYKIVVISSYPEIFYNNPRIWKNININKSDSTPLRIIRFLKGFQIEHFFPTFKNIVFEDHMRQTKSNIHLIEAHSQHFFHKIKQDKFKNEIFFSKDEIEQYRLKFKLLSRFSLINPVGKDSYTPNKNWRFDNFQQIVSSSDNINWIQVGISDDKKLLGVLDYRGATTLRELFYLVSKAEFILANEGLLNHIASAFNVKSYVVHSGFSQTALSKYGNTTFFSNNIACEYSPCWKLDECGIKNKPCINSIIPYKVLERIIKDKA